MTVDFGPCKSTLTESVLVVRDIWCGVIARWQPSKNRPSESRFPCWCHVPLMWSMTWKPSVWRSICNRVFLNLLSLSITHPLTLPHQTDTLAHPHSPSLTLSFSHSLSVTVDDAGPNPVTLFQSPTHSLSLISQTPHLPSQQTDTLTHPLLLSLSQRHRRRRRPQPTHPLSLTDPVSVTLSLTYAVSEANRRTKGESLYASCNVISSFCLFVFFFFCIRSILLHSQIVASIPSHFSSMLFVTYFFRFEFYVLKTNFEDPF